MFSLFVNESNKYDVWSEAASGKRQNQMNFSKTLIMYRKNFISEKVTFFVTRVFFGLLVFSSGLVDLHESAAKETEGKIKGVESAAVPEEDFTLESADGALSLKDFRGSVVLLFFGFTSCPDVCPISLATISHAFSYLTDDELKMSRSLFISLDPERDTMERLKKYTGYFHPNIIGVTGTMKELGSVTDIYGVKFEKKEAPDSALGYLIYHSAKIFVIGPQGELRKTFPHNIDAQLLVQQIRSLLKRNQL